MFTRLVSLLVVYIISTRDLSHCCQVKQFAGKDSFVCVCNEAYCDSIVTEPNSLPDHLTIFQSDAASHRFSKSIISFNELLLDSDALVDVHIKVNGTDRKQQIFGFGGSFTDSAGINIKKLPAKLVDQLIENYFSETKGLGYTYGRVPIAASDFSQRYYTYAEVADDFELKHFKLAHEDTLYKIPLIKKALSVSKDLRLISAPWAPPSWLKTSHRPKGLGILQDDPGSKYWKTYANYIVKFLETYVQHGIHFWGVSPQNEPSTGLMPNWPLNTCGFSGHMMRDYIKKDLGPALKKAGFGKDKVKLMIWDDQLLDIMPFIRVILEDKEAAEYVSGVAYHWYSRLSLGNWTRAERYATDIIEGLNHWSTGWVDWNLALDESGGPNWVNNFIDSMVIVNNTSPEYYKQPMYYVFGHFSRFLRPGSTRLGHSIIKNNAENEVKLTV
uniref:Glucosylceramidase n=2 Tax=Tetranychus urticae TaxID=32264 RepID=T1L1L4_TETUR